MKKFHKLATRQNIIQILCYFLPSLQALAKSECSTKTAILYHAKVVAPLVYTVPEKLMKFFVLIGIGTAASGASILWPLRVNVETHCSTLDFQSKAIKIFEKYYRAGAQTIEIVCFQVKHGWHGKEFLFIRDLLGRLTSACFPASLVKRLYTEFRERWSVIDAFYSKNWGFSTKRIARFIRLFNCRKTNSMGLKRRVEITQTTNAFQVSYSNAAGQERGSLFSRTNAGSRHLVSAQGGRV